MSTSSRIGFTRSKVVEIAPACVGQVGVIRGGGRGGEEKGDATFGW